MLVSTIGIPWTYDKGTKIGEFESRSLAVGGALARVLKKKTGNKEATPAPPALCPPPGTERKEERRGHDCRLCHPIIRPLCPAGTCWGHLHTAVCARTAQALLGDTHCPLHICQPGRNAREGQHGSRVNTGHGSITTKTHMISHIKLRTEHERRRGQVQYGQSSQSPNSHKHKGMNIASDSRSSSACNVMHRKHTMQHRSRLRFWEIGRYRRESRAYNWSG